MTGAYRTPEGTNWEGGGRHGCGTHSRIFGSGGTGATRYSWSVKTLRWRRRGRRRDDVCPARRDHVGDRPERRRQDLAAEHGQWILPPLQRVDPAGRARHHPSAPVPGRVARRRPHLPEHRAVRRHDRARQHHAWAARAYALRRVRLVDLLGPGAEGGDRPSRARRGIDRAARAAGDPQATLVRAALRAAQARRAGPRAGAGTQGAAAGRADGRA